MCLIDQCVNLTPSSCNLIFISTIPRDQMTLVGFKYHKSLSHIILQAHIAVTLQHTLATVLNVPILLISVTTGVYDTCMNHRTSTRMKWMSNVAFSNFLAYNWVGLSILAILGDHLSCFFYWMSTSATLVSFWKSSVNCICNSPVVSTSHTGAPKWICVYNKTI